MRSFVSILSRWKSILVAVGFPMALLGFIWWSVSTYRAAQIQADIEHFAGLPEFRDVDSDLAGRNAGRVGRKTSRDVDDGAKGGAAIEQEYSQSAA